MNASKYHRFDLKYLLKHGFIDSFYQVAKEDENNVGNDHRYKNACEDFVKLDDVKYNEEKKIWTLNLEKFPFFEDKILKDIFLDSCNEELLDCVLNNEKITFREWMIKFSYLQKDIIKGLFKNGLNKKELKNYLQYIQLLK